MQLIRKSPVLLALVSAAMLYVPMSNAASIEAESKSLTFDYVGSAMLKEMMRLKAQVNSEVSMTIDRNVKVAIEANKELDELALVSSLSEDSVESE